MLRIMPNLNTYNQIQFGQKQTNNMKPIFIEDEYDTFVSSVIRKEKDVNNGQIYRYKDFLTKKEAKRFKADLKNAVGTLVINDNLHIIKQSGNEEKFIDVIKKIHK